MDKLTRAQQRVLTVLGNAHTYEEVIKVEKALTVELNVNILFDMVDGYLQSAVTDRLAVISGQLREQN